MISYHVDYIEWGEYPTHTVEYEGTASSLQEVYQQLYAQTLGNNALNLVDYKDLFNHEILYVTGIEDTKCSFSANMRDFMGI